MTVRKLQTLKLLIPALITLIIALSGNAGEREDYTFAYNLYEEKAYSEAKAQFQEFIQNYPDSENADDARYLMGVCAFELGQYEEAIKHYKKLETNYPGSPLRLDAVYGVAASWFQLGKYEEAIEAYEIVVKDSKDAKLKSKSLYATGEAYENLGDYRRAYKFYNRLTEEYPESDEYESALYAKGWSLYRLEDYKKAYEAFSGLIENFPNNPATPEASYRLAECLLEMQDWKEAEKAYRRVIEDYSDIEEYSQMVADARFRLGESYFRQGKFEESRNTFDRLMHDYSMLPIAAQAQYWIAEVLLEEGKYTEAIHEYKKVITLYTDSDVVDDAHYGIGYAYFKQEKYPEAAKQFKIAARTPGSDLADASYFRIGECFRLQREFNTAIFYYKKIQSRSEYYDDALYWRGVSAFQLRDYEQAVKMFKSLIRSYQQRTPHKEQSLQPYAQFQLGLTYYRDRQYKKASQAFDLFLSENPKSTLEGASADEALYWQARARYELKDYRRTIESVERLISQFPDSKLRYKAEFFRAESTYWLGRTRKNFANARAMYQNILNIYPTYEWAEKCQYGIGWTYFSEAELMRDKNQSEAYSYYRNAIDAWKKVISDYRNGESDDKAQYHIGIAYLNTKDYDAAIESFQTVRMKYRNSDLADNALYRIGWAYYKKENYATAIDFYRKMSSEHPSSILLPNAVFGIANCYFKQGKYEMAIKHYQIVVKNYPNTKMSIHEAGIEKQIDLRPEALYYIGESHYNLQRFSQAISAYSELVRQFPKDERADEAQYGIAICYKQMGQDDKAVQAYRKLVRDFPNRSIARDVQLNLGVHYFRQKNYAQAIAEFQKVIEQYPKTEAASRAKYNIGRSYVKLGSFQQAIRMFKKINDKSSIAAKAAFEIARAWYDERNKDRSIQKAISAFENVVNKFPKEPEATKALLYIVECYTVLGKWEKAVNSCRRLIKLYPESEQAQWAQLSLGHSFRRLRRYDDALKAYQVITEDRTDQYDIPVVIEALMYQGEVLSKQKKYQDAALSYLKVALTYDKQDPTSALSALVNAASAYEELGQLNDAKNWLSIALRDYSEHPKKDKSWKEMLDYIKKRLSLLEKEIQKGTIKSGLNIPTKKSR